MESSSLDAVDYAILHHLQQNARKSITDIADAVDVSDNTIRNRIQNLEDEDVIQGYQVNIDYDQADIQHHYMFICSASVSRREQLAERAREQSGVTEVITLMTGNHNVYILGVKESKNGITELAYDIDDMGLEIEREHLVRDHFRQPFAGFRLEPDLSE